MHKLTKLFVIGALFFAIAACDSGDRVVVDDLRLRGVLEQINKLDGGAVYFTLVINGMTSGLQYGVTGQETRISLSASELRSGVNTIRVEFYFKSGDANAILIADSVQSVDSSQGDVITLAGLEYRYTDADNDTIINAHELMQSDADPDDDSFPNYLDTDSDGDGINDGVDFSPYGAITTSSDNITLISFPYESLTGTALRINIGSIAGNSGVLGALNEDRIVSVYVPSAWPMPGVPMVDIATQWAAFEVSAGSNGLCSEWRISRDASSISSSLSKIAYGLFQRADDTFVLVPVNNGDVADFSLYGDSDAVESDRSIDNSLVALLVSPNTAGWVTLYSQRNFSGNACHLNSTFPGLN